MVQISIDLEMQTGKKVEKIWLLQGGLWHGMELFMLWVGLVCEKKKM